MEDPRVQDLGETQTACQGHALALLTSVLGRPSETIPPMSTRVRQAGTEEGSEDIMGPLQPGSAVFLAARALPADKYFLITDQKYLQSTQRCCFLRKERF